MKKTVELWNSCPLSCSTSTMSSKIYFFLWLFYSPFEYFMKTLTLHINAFTDNRTNSLDAQLPTTQKYPSSFLVFIKVKEIHTHIHINTPARSFHSHFIYTSVTNVQVNIFPFDWNRLLVSVLPHFFPFSKATSHIRSSTYMAYYLCGIKILFSRHKRTSTATTTAYIQPHRIEDKQFSL